MPLIHASPAASYESATAIAIGVTGTIFTDTDKTDRTMCYSNMEAMNFWRAVSYPNDAGSAALWLGERFVCRAAFANISRTHVESRLEPA